MRGTILLIDDAENWYQTVAFILQEEGYEVLWARSRLEARTKLESDSEGNIDIVAVNLNLRPDSSVLDGTGYLMLEELRQKWPHLPRIAISSLEESQVGTATAHKVVELYDRYKVRHVAIKGGQDFTDRLVHAIKEITGDEGVPNSDSSSPNNGLRFEVFKQVRLYLGQNQLELAIEELHKLKLYQEYADLLSSRFARTKEHEIKGTLARSEVEAEYSKITNDILTLISSYRT